MFSVTNFDVLAFGKENKIHRPITMGYNNNKTYYINTEDSERHSYCSTGAPQKSSGLHPSGYYTCPDMPWSGSSVFK